ncbi:MAG: toxin-antitoxin system HicB family antitoxin [Clostridia bacterium]|nr:toxin-antitoxin system HicB family antitoxin [Clostridia bacterium]
MDKVVKDYYNLQYQVNLRPISDEDGGGWFAEIPDLKGCYSDGSTQEEALNNINNAKEAWIKTALKRGQEIPLPSIDPDEEEYSGKFTLRLPKFLHRELTKAASKEDISLNSYILYLLSFNFGKTQPSKDKSVIQNVLIYSAPPTLSRKRYEEYDEINVATSRAWAENLLGGAKR